MKSENVTRMLFEKWANDITVEDWGTRFCRVENSTRHWEEGRSAWALASFIANGGKGRNRIIEEVDKILLSDNDRLVSLGMAEIECRCPFDDYRNTRRQDMGILGKTKNGNNVFIGIEAKVDEPFGQQTIGEAYKIAQRDKNPNSKKVKRIEELCEKFGVKPMDEDIGNLRYQLFHFTAGTACVPKNGRLNVLGAGEEIHIHIMLTLVFRTLKYNEHKGAQNKADYDRFIKRFFQDGRLIECQLPSRPYAVYCEI